MNKRTEILETAKHLVNGDRQEDYGDAVESFQAIAEMWSACLGVAVSGRDICNLMALLKIARLRNGPHEDSSVDGAGYLALGAEIGQW